MGETRKLIMGTFTEDSVTDRAGKAAAATISNTVPGVYVETWPSKGAYMNIEHLFDGTYDLVIVPAGAAYEAYTGTGACEGEKKEKLRAVAASDRLHVDIPEETGTFEGTGTEGASACRGK